MLRRQQYIIANRLMQHFEFGLVLGELLQGGRNGRREKRQHDAKCREEVKRFAALARSDDASCRGNTGWYVNSLLRKPGTYAGPVWHSHWRQNHNNGCRGQWLHCSRAARSNRAGLRAEKERLR